MNKKLTSRDLVMLVILVFLLGGVCYYMFFFKPLQEDLAAIAAQEVEVQANITTAQGKLAVMNDMKAEVDEIKARPASEITEIAAYDNAKVVMNELNGILAISQEYSLTFADPQINEDGTVRRNVSLSCTCTDYTTAKIIIDSLTRCHWRCLISSVSIDGDGNITEGPVSMNATMTFFESTNIK